MFPKILVVDDSATDRLIISKMLSGHDLLLAEDGLDALRLMAEHPDIDIVILDLNMPKMDGFQLISEMKSGRLGIMPRIIILTNHDELDNEKRGLQLGAVDFIRKPLHFDSLNARINVHIELLRIQQALEKELYEQGLTFDLIFNQAPMGIAINFNQNAAPGMSGRALKVNPMYEQITGRTEEELYRIGWEGITHPDDLEEELRYFERLNAGMIDAYSMEKRYIKPDGSVVWVFLVVSLLKLSDGQRNNYICLVQDITGRKKIEAELIESERAKSVLLSNLPGMAYRCMYDDEWTMVFVSKRCQELTGYPPESLIGNNVLSFNDVIAPEYREILRDEWKEFLSKHQSMKAEYEIITAAGERKWVLEMGEGIFDGQGKVEALEGIIIDITDRKMSENALKYSNEHDSWTGLLNRRSLESFLDSKMNRDDGGKMALIVINLSGFQSLTTAFGFHYVQDLIRKVSATLSLQTSHQRLLFRTYENRFVLYLEDYQDMERLMEICEGLAGTLQQLLSSERVGGGIGVVVIEQGRQESVDRLLQRLLIASERAIRLQNRDFCVCIYDAEIEKQVLREEEILRELTNSIEDVKDGGLFLQYQPIMELKNGRICGFEALARMRSAVYGLIPPLEFIPYAEKNRLIKPIGWKIMRQAFGFLKKLEYSGLHDVGISVNISAIQLLDGDFSRYLFDLINEFSVLPGNITLEVTESVFASNYGAINRILGTIRDNGIHIAIDDFGTGYSSLERESEMNVNNLKIDKSFISRIKSAASENVIVSDIVSISHKMGHYVTAEGVEQELQIQYLSSCGCDRIQGYLISRPLDEEQAIGFLKKQK